MTSPRTDGAVPTAAAARSDGGIADLYDRSDALSLAGHVRRGDVTAAELAEEALRRIEQRNPPINAVVRVMADEGRRLAAQRDASRDASPGAFAGVPFLIKDLLSNYAGTPITSGSRLLAGWVPPHHSEVVERYLRAGLVILGKTNTPEFGLTPFTEPELFGPARNPWDLSRTTGGSSGGSAAAVAAGIVPMAGGGDGGGSIRIPASCCGVFGLKPTRGRVPTGPDVGELWQGAVVEHVLTRSVRDSAAMLDAIAGPDVGAPYWTPPPARPFLEEVGADPGRLRIAVTTTPILGHAVDPECVRAVADARELLASMGHELVDDTPAVDGTAFNRAFLTLVCGELWADVSDAERLVGRKRRAGEIEDATRALALIGGEISAGEFAAADRFLHRVARDIARFFERYDLLLSPTVASPPVPIGSLQPKPADRVAMKVLGTLGAGGVLRRLGALETAAESVFDFIPWPPLFNITGQPAMSVPLHWTPRNLPVGIHLAARAGDEATLFRVAARLEEARPWWERRPELVRR